MGYLWDACVVSSITPSNMTSKRVTNQIHLDHTNLEKKKLAIYSKKNYCMAKKQIDLSKEVTRSTQPKGSLWFHLEENVMINELKLKMAPGWSGSKKDIIHQRAQGIQFL